MERKNRANETRAKEAENQTKHTERERERERERNRGNRQGGSQMAPVDYLPSGHEDA